MDDSKRSELRQILTEAAAHATESLGAERGILVYEGYGITMGMEAETLWIVGEISHSLLQALLDEKEPLVLMDAAEDWGETSAVLSNLRSVLYVPLRNQADAVVGMYYVDNRAKAGAFTNDQLQLAVDYVDATLMPRLHQLPGNPDFPDLDWDALTATVWV